MIVHRSTLRSLVCAGVLLFASVPARADLPPAGLQDLIPTLLPHVVNVSFFRVEKDASGQLVPVSKGVGSGYVVDASGIIFTNRHVTDEGNEYFVVFADQLQLRAELIYRSPDIDLAVLRVYPSKPLIPVKWGDSDLLRQGDQVVAIGNPLGLAGTVTTGIVSARDRSIGETDLDAFIQVDAAINPGNSGGPLFNMKGEMVGMDTAFYSVPGAGPTGSIGLNFAMPANDVKFVLDSLRAHGRVQRGYLGATLNNITGNLATAWGLPFTEGAIVARVLPDTPAAAAKLQEGDILLKMADHPIRNARDANRFIAAFPVNQAFSLVLQRAGKQMTISATLIDASKETVTIDLKPPAVQAITAKQLGIQAAAMTDTLRQKFSLRPDLTGIVLTAVDPNGLAAGLGFAVGDVVVRMQDTPIQTIDDMMKVAAQARAEKRGFVAVLKANNQGMLWTAVPVSE